MKESELDCHHSKRWSQFQKLKDTKEEAHHWNSKKKCNDTQNTVSRKWKEVFSIQDFIIDIQKKKQSSLISFINRRNCQSSKSYITDQWKRRLIGNRKIKIWKKSESHTKAKKPTSWESNTKKWLKKWRIKFCMQMSEMLRSWMRNWRILFKNIKLLFHTIQNKMNQCRICWKSIQRMFNWWPALRCSECRKIKDEELQTIIEDTTDVYEESESAIEDVKRFQMRNKLLQQRNQVLQNDNQRLETENQKLSDWIKRLFERINKLEKENYDLNKKVEEQYFEIQQFEQWFSNWSRHWDDIE